jgi:GTPase involved in cell partitioning and DNA repair
MATAGKPSGIVIQALRHIGRKHVDVHVIDKIRDLLSDDDKGSLKKDLDKAPDWLRPIVDEIAS